MATTTRVAGLPRLDPTIDRNTTNFQRQKLTHLHDVKIFYQTVQDKTDGQLKDLIIKNVGDEYINKFKKEYIGYDNETTKTMLAHIKK